ncbi:MAG: DUF4010 domain-containing protein, partial [Inhella sp.]
LGPIAPALLRDWLPVALAGMATALICALLLAPRHVEGTTLAGRRPLRPREALLLAALLSGVTAAVSFAQQRLGELGVLGGAVLAGLADAHAALPSLAALAAEARITPALLATALLLALGANSLTRSLVALGAGGPRYGGLIAGALALQLLVAGFVAWLG